MNNNNNNNNNNNKTLWQKIYSFFGFWTYTLNEQIAQIESLDKYLNRHAIECDSQGEDCWTRKWLEESEKCYIKYKIIYFCPPWGRKIDIFRYKI